MRTMCLLPDNHLHIINTRNGEPREEEQVFTTISEPTARKKGKTQKRTAKSRCVEKKRYIEMPAVWIAGRRRTRQKAGQQRRQSTRVAGRLAGEDNELPDNSIFALSGDEDTNHIFTRVTDPFKAEHVKAIVDAVKIGDDVTADEKTQIEALIAEFADCFALSVKEVLPGPGTKHRLNVLANTTFPRKVHQRLLTPPQREFVYKKIDELLETGVIEPCEPSKVKCVALITLAHKVHEGPGLSMEELQRRVNKQCMSARLPKAFDVPDREPHETRPEPPQVERKWRMCHNFGAINKVMEVAPMPQGDIRAKQQRVSRHRCVCTFDFALGFYVVTVVEESRPYTCFYVEG